MDRGPGLALVVFAVSIVLGCGDSPPGSDASSFDAPAGAFELTVTLEGDGGGVVTSLPMGIFCGADCTEVFAPGTEVTLAVSPDMSSMFGGWTGDCTGTDLCIVTMTATRAVGAVFDAR